MTILKRMTAFLLTLVLATPAFAQDPPPEVPPPSDNAAVWYLTASELWNRGHFDVEASTIAESFSEVDLDKAGPALDRLEHVLYYAREGAKRDKCSWAVDMDLGPALLVPHLARMRTLTRILAVSAQVRLERGDTAGAIEDWLTIMRMAPHAAADGLLISNLVQTSMDMIAIETLAKRLDALDRDALESLKQGLAGLNERHPIWRTLASERVFVGWVRREFQANGVEGLRDIWVVWAEGQAPPEVEALPDDPDLAGPIFIAWLDELDSFFDRVVEVFKLPAVEFEQQAAELDREAEDSANPLIRLLTPIIGGARRVELRAQSIRAMIDAMIAYRLGGEQAFKQVVDPYDGRPFDFEVTDAGVVLRSRQIHHDDQRVSLTFSAGCAEPLE